MVWQNVTGIDYIDIFVSGYSQNVFGDQLLAFFTFAFIIMLAFVVAKAPRETIFMVPAIALIGFANYYGVTWLTVVLMMIGGIYLYFFFTNLISSKEK